jgi:hypothetical protein
VRHGNAMAVSVAQALAAFPVAMLTAGEAQSTGSG